MWAMKFLDDNTFGIRTLSVVIVLAILIFWHSMRHSSRPKIVWIVGGYNILLLIGFIGALLPGITGWASLFVSCLTLPWDILLFWLPSRFTHLIASNWFGNFVFFYVVCGGLNSILLYLFVLKTNYTSCVKPSTKTIRDDGLSD
ncbi:MAG: hypothetical protein P4L10_02630 [Acidobacteriaceae bacterium]|nr:hypothetical protein [Acidobacteriaceae bacterium]